MRLNNPILIGFGISNATTFQEACKYGSGAIIGSAYINALKDADDITTTTKEFVQEIIA